MGKTTNRSNELIWQNHQKGRMDAVRLRHILFGADLDSRDYPRFKNKMMFGEDQETDMWYPGVPFPLHWKTHHIYFNHFNTWTAGDWTITTVELGAGDATEAIQDAQFGVVRFTNDAADNDYDSIQSKEIAKLVAGKDLFFDVRFRISDATQSDAILGLCITDTEPVGGATDYVYFVKDDGDTNWDFVAAKDSSETEKAAVATADTSWHSFGFYADGITSITPFIDGVRGTLINTAASINDNEEMCLTMHIQNGEAAAKWLEVDYILLIQER